MIRRCEDREFGLIWTIINDGAWAYEGVIPADCLHIPYMSEEELRREMQEGVEFWAYEEGGEVQGVMGIQSVQDVTLIRHAYVRTGRQKQGVGAKLLAELRQMARGPVLIGTWKDAGWAIRFYQKHGFRLVEEQEKVRVLKKYWEEVLDGAAAADRDFRGAGRCELVRRLNSPPVEGPHARITRLGGTHPTHIP